MRPPRLLTLAQLRRARVRVALLTVGASLLVFVVLFQQLLLGAVLGGITGALGRQSGTVVTFAADAQRSAAGSLLLPPQVDAVAAVPGVAAVGSLGITSRAVVTADGAAFESTVIGFQPDRPGTPVGVTSGRLPAGPGEVAASSEDAAGRYRLGDVVTLQPGGLAVTVVGLTEGSRFNVAPTLWVPWDGYVASAQAANPDAALVLPSVLAVTAAPGIDDAALARDITDAVAGVEAVTRADAVARAPGLGSVRVAFGLVMGLGYLVVGLVIGFFFLTMTVQRQPSTTLLRASGAASWWLLADLALQVLAITSVAVAGAVAALWLVVPLVQAHVPITVEAGPLVTSVAGVALVASLGAVASGRRIVRADPYAAVTRAALGGLA